MKSKPQKKNTKKPAPRIAMAVGAGAGAVGRSSRKARSKSKPNSRLKARLVPARPAGARRAARDDASGAAAATIGSRMKRTRSKTVLAEPKLIDQGSLGEAVALRAFLKWQERGGDEMSNWLDAEREVLSELEASRRSRAKGATGERRSSKRRSQASSPR